VTGFVARSWSHLDAERPGALTRVSALAGLLRRSRAADERRLSCMTKSARRVVRLACVDTGIDISREIQVKAGDCF